MPDSNRQPWLPKVRTAVFLIGIVTVGVGAVLGALQQWNPAAFFMITGFVMTQFSETGRPIIVNVFTEMEEEKDGLSSGYL